MLLPSYPLARKPGYPDGNVCNVRIALLTCIRLSPMFCSNASVEPDVTMFTQACSELGTVVACLYITPEWLPHTHFTRNASVQPHCIISFYPEKDGFHQAPSESERLLR